MALATKLFGTAGWKVMAAVCAFGCLVAEAEDFAVTVTGGPQNPGHPAIIVGHYIGLQATPAETGPNPTYSWSYLLPECVPPDPENAPHEWQPVDDTPITNAAQIAAQTCGRSITFQTINGFDLEKVKTGSETYTNQIDQ